MHTDEKAVFFSGKEVNLIVGVDVIFQNNIIGLMVQKIIVWNNIF